jgi:hypothetical protein
MTTEMWRELMRARVAKIEEARAAERVLRERIFWGLLTGYAAMIAAGVLLLSR